MAKKRGSAVRTILLFVVGVLVLGALIILVSLRKPAPPILPPETPEMLAKRAAPENSYFAFEEAAKLLPGKETTPPPAMPPKPEMKPGPSRGPWRPPIRESITSSLSRVLLLASPQGNPQAEGYLDKCAPAMAKVREGLARPYFLLPVTWPDFREFMKGYEKLQELGAGFCPLGDLLLAQGTKVLRSGGDPIEAWGYLFDALRMGRMLVTDGALGADGWGLQTVALKHIAIVAPEFPEAAARKAIEDLRAFQGATPPLKANVEFWCHMVDNMVKLGELPMEQSHRGDEMAAGNFVTGVYKKKINYFLREHLDEVLEASRLKYADYFTWQEQHRALMEDRRWFRIWDPLRFMLDVPLMTLSRCDTLCGGARLALALELHRRARGAYPDTLQALTPEYLTELPADTLSGSPFVYKRVENDYLLYSVGPNRKDEDAKNAGEDDGVVDLMRLPEEAHRDRYRQKIGNDDVVIHHPVETKPAKQKPVSD